MKIQKAIGLSAIVLAFMAAVVFPTASVWAGEAKKTDVVKGLTVAEAVALALDKSPLLERARIDYNKARLYHDEVNEMKWLPKFTLSAQFGVVPGARGDIFYSPDKQTDLDQWGPFIKYNLKLVQPVLTFGRLSAARDAARCAIDVQRLQNDSESEKLIFQVISAYWALYCAREAESVASDVDKNFKKLVSEIKKRVESESSEVDDTDLLEVQSNGYQIREILEQSRMERSLAEKALGMLLNMDSGGEPAEPLALAVEPTPVWAMDGARLAAALSASLLQHRDINTLNAAINGLDARSRIARGERKPLIFLAGGIAYALAPHRDDQTNPFAVDEFNYFSMGAFFSIEWDLNFFRKNVAAERFKLEKKSMEQNLILARKKLEFEITKAAAEVEKNAVLAGEAEESLKAAKNWLRLGMDNWEMGLGEVERLIKAYNAYYQLKGVQIKRILELNTSIARLAFILGNTRLVLEWIKNGKIEIN